VNPEILRYYQAGLEADRLSSPFFEWERIRTLDLLARFLPPAPAHVLDVGGAAGAYAFPLAEMGYVVDLLDPMPLHIEQARQRAISAASAPRSFQVADARAIPSDDGVMDAVLMFGPLYHLDDRGDRLRAIGEARRVLRPGGVLMAVAISRFASAMDGMARGLIRDPEFVRIVEHDLQTGEHRNPTGHQDYFTNAFFHHPDEFQQELVEGGFPSAKLYAIEGPIWTPELQAAEPLMAILRSLENEGTLIGASAHIMGIGRKS
jgi:SAM-dependent methyltransferase